MPPRKPTGVDVRQNSDGSTSYRIRWRQGGGRNGAWASHTFRRRADALSALRSIELAGWRCYCERHAPPGDEAGQFGAQASTDRLTWGSYARRSIANRTGIGDYYRARFTRELDLHCRQLLDLRFDEVTLDRARGWLRGLERAGLSPTTIRRLRAQASSVQRDAVEAGLATANPFTRLRIAKQDRHDRREMVALSHEEWARLRAALAEGVPRDLCTVLITTGLRWGEVTALTVGDVDLADRRLTVRQAWKPDGQLGPPKSSRSRRTISISELTVQTLRPYVDGRPAGALVFTGRAGAALRAANFHRDHWRPAIDRAGLERRPRVHDLRHSHASWLIGAGRPLTAVSRRLGHESAATTDRIYSHMLPQVDLDDAATLDRIMPPEDD